MAKKSTPKTSKAVKASTSKAKSTPAVRVKTTHEVAATLNNFVIYNLHGRYNFHFSTKTQKQVVAYGPWLAALSVAIMLPQLMVFAKQGSLMTLNGFFNSIFFNQQSWVIMLIMLANIMLLVDGISYIFEKKYRGWKRIYQATLMSSLYVFWQLITNITEPAAALVSIIGALFILFAIIDVRNYYK